MSTYEMQCEQYKTACSLMAYLYQHSPNLCGLSLAEIANRLAPARHAPDFRSVFWFGASYDFNATEAAMVAEPWGAWELGTPKVGAGRLLSATDMIGDRVSEVFKRNPAWGSMVQTDNKGTYWLQMPGTELLRAKSAA